MSQTDATLGATWDALSGHYLLRPGQVQSIGGQRPVLGAGRLGRLLRGQSGVQVADTLSSVFTLCAHAHRLACALALKAARGAVPTQPFHQPPAALLLETARDHLRSVALDWPQRLPDVPGRAHLTDWLRDCPLRLAAPRVLPDEHEAWATLAALRVWLERNVLHEGVNDWLASYGAPGALGPWCQAHAAELLPARCLATWYPLAHTLTPATRWLDLLDADEAQQTAQLRELAQALVLEADFSQHPRWQGACAESGPWARLRHRARPAQAQCSAWTRLSARWLELLELAAATPDAPGAPLLACGALALGSGQALAWCEMARGLLLHWVRLDAAGAVLDYRVLAPTEWNFHPEGALAQALSALSPADSQTTHMLAAAFDPCVACTVQALQPESDGRS